jgi:hypothetical protein
MNNGATIQAFSGIDSFFVIANQTVGSSSVDQLHSDAYLLLNEIAAR